MSTDASAMAEAAAATAAAPARRRSLRLRPWMAVVGLLLLAALTQWLLWWFAPRAEVVEFVGPLRPDYSLEEFELRVFRDDGLLSFTVTAPFMDRHGGDGHFVVNQPQMLILRNGTAQWQARSDSSVIEGRGDYMRLLGDVHFHSLDNDPQPVDIRTDHLTAWPDSQRVETDADVVVERGSARLYGTALRADFTTSRMELDDLRLHAPPAR